MEDFEFPTTVASLDEVPEEWRDLYRSNEGGAELIPEAAQAIEAARIEFETAKAALEDEYRSKIAEREAAIIRTRNELHDRVANRSIREALLMAGVIRPGLQKAAIALFRRRFPIAVVKQDDGTFETSVANSFGSVSVADAVAAWLGTEEGATFAPPKAVPGTGLFAAEVARLKGQMH